MLSFIGTREEVCASRSASRKIHVVSITPTFLYQLILLSYTLRTSLYTLLVIRRPWILDSQVTPPDLV